jgi:hypothetical protein
LTPSTATRPPKRRVRCSVEMAGTGFMKLMNLNTRGGTNFQKVWVAVVVVLGGKTGGGKNAPAASRGTSFGRTAAS